MSGATERAGNAAPRPPVLHVHRVDVRFGDATVLEHVDFDLPAGEFLAIVGPNGAGKTTLVKTILGLVKPSRGHAAVFGRDAGEEPDRVGYVPQIKTFDRTFPATALELVVSGLRRSWPVRVSASERAAAEAALTRVGAGHLRRRPLARLSGGELQRVYLARAFVRRPDLLILDEPATGVDVLAEHDLYHLLEAYQRDDGATVAMITHDLSAARHHASAVLVLNRRVYGYGTPDDVLHEACLKKAYGHAGHAHSVLVI